MGVRASIVVCVTSFLLGALFTHWIADSLTLWKSPVTDEHLWTAASYYSILTKGPLAIRYVLAAIVLLGASSILSSLNDLRAGNIMFDGGSIFLFATTIVMYLNSVLPSLSAMFSSLPSHGLKDPFPRALRIATLELASNNLICSVALTGVLALQAGRFFAESTEDEDDDYVLVEQDNLAPTPSIKPEAVPSSTKEPASSKARKAKTPDLSIPQDAVKPLLQQRVQAS